MKNISKDFLWNIFMFCLCCLMIYQLKQALEREYLRKKSEIGKNFTLSVSYGNVQDTGHSLIRLETPGRNTGICVVPVSVNELSTYLYEVKVLGIDSLAFIRTRSRYHP
ncbi:MAG: hypothetical protein WCQ32_00025 [bacterium]